MNRAEPAVFIAAGQHKAVPPAARGKAGVGKVDGAHLRKRRAAQEGHAFRPAAVADMDAAAYAADERCIIPAFRKK